MFFVQACYYDGTSDFKVFDTFNRANLFAQGLLSDTSNQGELSSLYIFDCNSKPVKKFHF